MNKRLYNFTQGKLQQFRQGGRIKNSVLANQVFVDYNFGQLDITKQWLTFTIKDIIDLSKDVQRTIDRDIRHDSYPNTVDRLTTATVSRNEKTNSFAVSQEFILVNSLSDIFINQTKHKISPLTSLGVYLKAEEILSVEHSAIVMVENLAVMANLKSMKITVPQKEVGVLPFSNNEALATLDLTQALWLYRGDVKPQQTTNTSYQFFRRFKASIPLICFSDLDPKGIEIALTSHADYWLTLQNANEVTMPLLGSEQEWHKQSASIKFLHHQVNKQRDKTVDEDNKDKAENPSWQNTFNILLTHKKTLKQEHMLKHKLGLTLLKVSLAK